MSSKPHSDATLLRDRVRRTLGDLVGSAVMRTSEGAGRLRDAARDLRPSASLLPQALAARERGNLEAAYFLLQEAWATEPDTPGVPTAFWDVAMALGRAQAAATAAVSLVERCADEGVLELGVQYLAELSQEVPDATVKPMAVARLLPALRERIDKAADEGRSEAEALLRHALELALDPRNETPSPGLALRLFAEARTVHSDSARRAAEIALASPHLHEAKRTLLCEFLDRPASPPAVEQDRVHGVPESLDREVLVVRRRDGAALRVSWREIEAVAVARIEAPDETVTIVDLVFNWTRRDRESLRLVRLRDDGFDPAQLVSSGEDPLADFLAEILERSRAIPLPDPESALGLRPAVFDSLEAYELSILGGPAG